MWHVFVGGVSVGHARTEEAACQLAGLFIGPEVRFVAVASVSRGYCEFCPVTGGDCGVCRG